MHPLILTTATVALFFQNPAATVKQKTVSGELSQGQLEVLFRICKNVETEEMERCKARQLKRYNAQDSKSNATEAKEAYDSIDLGKGKLRARLKVEQKKETSLRARARKTFREDPNQMSTSLQPRGYVDFIRTERLKCMLMEPGRPRNLCLDELGNTARKLMQDARPSEQRKTP